MSERTDERERADEADLDVRRDESGARGDVDLSELDGTGTGAGSGAGGDVGFDDDELGVDVDALTSGPGAGTPPDGRPDSDTQSGSTTGERSRPRLRGRLRLGERLGGLVRNPLPSPPSPRSFVLSLAVTVVFMFVGGQLVPLPASGLLGVFTGAFILGVVSARRRYLELGVSGAVAAGLSWVVGSITLAALAGLAVPLAAFGAGSGAIAALLGHYFGRDLRDGLTRDV